MRLVTISLATSRLTRLVTEDEITAPLRDRVESWAAGAAEGSLKERLAYIPTCRACSSVWAAGIVLGLTYGLGRVGRPLVGTLAASEAGLTVSGLLDVISATTERVSGRVG